MLERTQKMFLTAALVMTSAMTTYFTIPAACADASSNTGSLEVLRASEQYAVISDEAQQGLDSAGNFTIEAWIKIEHQPVSQSTIVGKYSEDGSNRGYLFDYDNESGIKKLTLFINPTGAPGQNVSMQVNHTLSTGVWQHVAVSYNLTTGMATFYVDGVNIGSVGGGPLVLADTDASFAVGALDEPPYGQYFDGLIDEVRVWSKVRTEEEIRADMNRVLSGNEDGLEGYWRFENDFQDLSPNGNHLTPSNDPAFTSDIPFGGDVTQPAYIADDPALLEGLVSYWPLDEESGVRQDVHGANDLSDPTAVPGVSGILNTAADFEAESSHELDGGDIAAIDDTSTLSFAGWINLESESSSQDGLTYIATKWNNQSQPSGSSWRFYHLRSDDRLHLDSYNADGAYVEYVGTSEVSTGAWHHVAFVYDDFATPKVRFYLDGVYDSTSGTGGGLLRDVPSPFRLGAANDSDVDRWFDGLIDEVGIWNRALSADEVAKLYNGGAGLPYTLEEEPEPEPVNATSSVAFLPGIMGSRLYLRPGGGDPKKLWESIDAGDIGALALDAEGMSVHPALYTRDIIDVIRPLTGWLSFITAGEGYRGWIDFMDAKVAEGSVPEWKALPYDWRLATNQLITSGEEILEGEVYFASTPPGLPYILKELNALAERSPTGKVTVVAHSNGGLVAKNILRYLDDTNNPLLGKIDTVVLVASPQLGTPKAVREILHGIDMPSQQTVRDVLENMPGAYGLLPTEALVAKLPHDEPLVEIDQSVGSLTLMTDLAGRSIVTYEDLASFLRGDTGTRQSYHVLGYLNPNLLNGALLEQARAMHAGLDEWSAPESVRVIEILGTGLWTPRGVHYSGVKKRTKNGKSVSVLRTEWRANMDGDGTVLAASAAGGEADTTYYVDLAGYNESADKTYAHGTILSAPIVQWILEQNVFGTEAVTPIYMNTTGAKSGFPRAELRGYSPIDLHEYRNGKHTGVLSDAPTDLGHYFEVEVPNSHYEEWVDVKYLGVPLNDDGAEVVIDGTDTGLFTLAYDLYEGDALLGEYVFADVPVTAESVGRMRPRAGEAPELAYDMNGDGTVDLTLRPNEEGVSLTALDLMARLRAYVRAVEMPDWLRLWIDERLAVSEKLIKKGGKGNLAAAKAILRTVQLTIEFRKGTLIPEADAEVLHTLLRELVAKV